METTTGKFIDFLSGGSYSKAKAQDEPQQYTNDGPQIDIEPSLTEPKISHDIELSSLYANQIDDGKIQKVLSFNSTPFGSSMDPNTLNQQYNKLQSFYGNKMRTYQYKIGDEYQTL
jgi:hypothetical protein